MKKKICAIMVLVTMMFSMMSVGVYAATDHHNFDGYMGLYNGDCQYAEKAKATFILSKDGKEILNKEFPASETGGYVLKGNYPEINSVITDLEAVANAEATKGNYIIDVEKYGYKIDVALEENDPEHEFTFDGVAVVVYTEEICRDLADYAAGAWLWNIEDKLPANAGVEKDKDDNVTINGKPVTFADLAPYDALLAADEWYGEDYVNMKADVAAFEDQAFVGWMEIVANAECNCIKYTGYTVYHEYYDASGDYVAQEMVDGEAVAGTVIKTSELELVEEYDGEKYKVEGFYLPDPDTGEWDFNKPVKQFTVEESAQICIKYVKIDDSPVTGDDFNMMPWMLLAVMGLAVAEGVRRTTKA